MRKYIKSITALILASLMLLSACRSTTVEENLPNRHARPQLVGKSPTLGRYVEKTLDITPHDQAAYCISPDNTLEVFETIVSTKSNTTQSELFYQQKKGSNDFQVYNLPWDNTQYQVENILDVAYNRAGEQFILYTKAQSDQTENSQPYYCAKVDRDKKGLININMEWMVSDLSGKNVSPLSQQDTIITATVDSTPSTLSEEIIGDDSVMFSYDVLEISLPALLNLRIADNGDILISDSFGAIMHYDAQGDFKTAYLTANPSFALLENYLLVTNENNSQLLLYDLTQPSLNAISVPELGISLASIILTSNQKAFFIASPEGIFRLALKGTMWEKLVDGDTTSLSMPSLSFSQFLASNESEFYLQGINNDKRQLQILSERPAEFLYQYVYDATVPTKLSKQINILLENETLAINQAAALFRQNNPDTYVAIEVYDDKSEPFSSYVLDSLESLNPPDIILFNQAPFEPLNSSLLYDLSDFAQYYIDSKQWPENIVNAYRDKNGALPMISSRFEFQMVAAPPSIQTVADLASYSQKEISKPLLYDRSIPSLIYRLFPMVSHEIIDIHSGQINVTKLELFLEQIKTLHQNIPDNDSALYEQEQLTQNALAYGLDPSIFLTDDMLPYTFGDVEASIQTISIPYSYSLTQNLEQRLSYPYQPFPQGGHYVFLPRQIIALSQKSPNHESSLSFLEIFFSKKIQSDYISEYMPLDIGFVSINDENLSMDSMQVFYDFTGRSLQISNAANMNQTQYDSLKALYPKFLYASYNNQFFMDELIPIITSFIDEKQDLSTSIKQIRALLASETPYTIP